MFSTNSLRAALAALALVVGLAACGDVNDDLFPSAEDRRGTVDTGTVGGSPGQIVADFALHSTGESDFVLSDYLAGGVNEADAVVFYFTMWCPICTGHQDRILFDLMPLYENRGRVAWVLVDYVSGSVEVARAAQRDTGFLGTPFIVAVDETQELLEQVEASMSSTVVVNGQGVILMNETFRDGSGLVTVLDSVLPP